MASGQGLARIPVCLHQPSEADLVSMHENHIWLHCRTLQAALQKSDTNMLWMRPNQGSQPWGNALLTGSAHGSNSPKGASHGREDPKQIHEAIQVSHFLFIFPPISEVSS